MQLDLGISAGTAGTVSLLQSARRRLRDAQNTACCPSTQYDSGYAAILQAGAALMGRQPLEAASVFNWLARAGLIDVELLDELVAWPERRYDIERPVTLPEVERLVAAAKGLAGQ